MKVIDKIYFPPEVVQLPCFPESLVCTSPDLGCIENVGYEDWDN